MSNAPGTSASRSEVIAFNAVGQVLDAEIELADANGKNAYPDGRWDKDGLIGYIEVTALPDNDYMRSWAAANREELPHFESESISVDYGQLHIWIQEFLLHNWAKQNIEKLRQRSADERHLYLHGYSHKNRERLSRLSDTFANSANEPMGCLELPSGITSLWFEGRSTPNGEDKEEFQLTLARYTCTEGWSRHHLRLDEFRLPPSPPQPGLRAD